ncbi:RagB/SusD family nutrient uptake outer membrane protein [Bacteroides ihuae]|uniref:RagB/SusD family nutrient uptake outer membrane protein n=1 Tax=Bacteroides ihuae TaxID=1852362 RepID=UPI0008DA89F0|nr:RagB/SusD family nutrient uptake outer membrane protein [Bacteroides ihuae]
MKHFSKWFIGAFVGATIATSCVDEIKFGDSFLEKAPGVAVTQDTIFGKADYARRFLWNTYSKLYYGLATNWNTIDGKMNTGMFEALSDCWHSHNSWDGLNRKYYSGSYKASDEDDADDSRFGYTKENCWVAIRAAWLFIENVGRVPDMEDAEKTRLAAEAKVIIASRYFDLFRHLGGLPILEKSYDVAAAYELPRGTVEETVNFMVRLLDEATVVLPWDLENDGESNWQGRFTKAAAMGLKCKVLLFAASPLFNDSQPYCNEEPQDAVTNHQVWYGAYKPELWTQCLTACEDFFSELNTRGHYGLIQPSGSSVDAYRAAFNTAYFIRQDNTELLISTRIIGKYNWDWWYYWGDWVGNGGYTPTEEYMEMFPMADGSPFSWGDATVASNPFFTNNDYSKPIRDPRLYETILVNGAKYSGRAVELWLGGRENVSSTEKETGIYATGFGLYKFYKEGKSSLAGNYLEWPYLRLSEMYLIYAEALLKNNRLSDAIDQVDKVRARVGLKGLAEVNPTENLKTDANALMEEILRERACELGLEDVRLFDMVRNKRADLFQAPLHGLKIQRADGGSGSWSDKNASVRGDFPTKFTYTKFELTNKSRSWWTNFSPRWYLSAFPPSEVNKNYGLTQNPGWK